MNLKSFVDLTVAGWQGAIMPVDVVAEPVTVIGPVPSFTAAKSIADL